MANEPGKAVLSVFDQLIERIKSSRPKRTDGKQLETDFVYSQLVLGQMVDPDDFVNPWSPMGGVSVHDAVKAGTVDPNAGAAVVVPVGSSEGAEAAAATAAAQAASAAEAKVRRAMQAAFNTAELVDRMIMVTNDEVKTEYPTSRSIAFAYEGIVKGMQPLPAPPISPDVQARIDESKKILYEFDEDGEIAGKSKLYKRYKKNAEAYALAKCAFADAQSDALSNASKANSWPMKATALQNLVDDAYDTLKSEGAEKVERALGIIESVGLSIQDTMIAKARKVFDAWSLGLAGVPVTTPYASISPSSWADPDADDDGWQTLTVKSSEYHSHQAKNTHFFQQSSTHDDQSSTQASGSGSYFGFGAHASGGGSSANHNDQASANASAGAVFQNDAKDLTITLQYGLCDIHRPWLQGDLFYMKNWYLVNSAKNAISDGTIAGQVDSQDALLPMLPMQFLVIRNVTIESKEWGSDGRVLQQMYGRNRADSSNSGSNFSAGAHAGFGPISFSADVSHAESRSDGSQSSSADTRERRDFEASFDGQKLQIKGAQIIAWLSNIVPACPGLADPGLKVESAAKPARSTQPGGADPAQPTQQAEAAQP